MLEIKNLSFSVQENGKSKEILKNINLSLAQNKLYVITGQNGSGKSTLVKIIMGILSQTSGQIFFGGKDISSMPIHERARLGISFAFQSPVTFKGLKVKELLDIASGQKNSLSQNCDYLSKVGLCARDYIDRYIDDKLSGGELKRIELAMALSRKGKLNIFDEPEAGIDLWSFDKLVSLFSSVKGTTLIVSHQRKILEIADKIILMKNGEIVKVGGKEEILPLTTNSSCTKLRGENE